MRYFLALIVAALVITTTAEAQQGKRRAAPGGARRLRDTAAPQSGTPVGTSQNSTLGVQALRPPTRPSYQPPSKPITAPKERQVGGNPMTARTRGMNNPYAGHDMRGQYARHAPVGGRRLRSQNSRSVQENLMRNLTRFSGNNAINNRFAIRSR